MLKPGWPVYLEIPELLARGAEIGIYRTETEMQILDFSNSSSFRLEGHVGNIRVLAEDGRHAVEIYSGPYIYYVIYDESFDWDGSAIPIKEFTQNMDMRKGLNN